MDPRTRRIEGTASSWNVRMVTEGPRVFLGVRFGDSVGTPEGEATCGRWFRKWSFGNFPSRYLWDISWTQARQVAGCGGVAPGGAAGAGSELGVVSVRLKPSVGNSDLRECLAQAEKTLKTDVGEQLKAGRRQRG